MGKRVAVVGLGTMGSMTLWKLSQQGVDVTGFEQFGVGHDRSAVGGESRLFRTAYREGPEYVPLLKRSRELWRELEKESGNQLLTLNGGLTIDRANSDNFKNVLKSIYDYQINHEVFDIKEAVKLFPQHKFSEEDAVILDKESGFLRPELAVVSACYLAEKNGAEIYRHSKIDSINQKDEKVEIKSDGKVHEFDEVIVSAGSWVKELLPEFKEIIEPRRIIMSWFIPEDLAGFQKDVFPVFARTTEKYDFFGAPTLDQSMVKIALVGSDEPFANPNKLEHNIPYQEVLNQTEIVKSFFHGINPDPVRLSVHMDAYTPDEHALVGRIEDKSNIIVLSGYSGHGFKLAPIMGEIAAEIVLQDQTQHDINHMNPNRFKK
ncbi:N-methyl-L-tryptophan oxidase [Oceanobacillus sojae]|uniref:N-methyl-L-tryptophan oxidase n=1 Tax=Oceanobacillus sojae TaxID=582851 RepID=UPI00158D9DB0|nr:N-methyl-L-tryptophan oxidase [Oceanobacillus sojae]MCT1903069.1 N-methyl-L-tryptophan oxidase [Oceanobacillus sojae]